MRARVGTARVRFGGRVARFALLAAVAPVVAACGSDGPKTLRADDLAERADTICRTATRAFEDIDTDDPEKFLKESVDVFSTASDGLEALHPDDAVADDFDDLTSSISKQVRQAKKVQSAVEDGDDDAVTEQVAAFSDLAADSDELADDLDMGRCVGLGMAALGPVAESAPPTTDEPATTDVATTAAPTLPVTTATLPPTTVPVTIPPITTVPQTTPATTAAPATTAPADTGGADGNLIDDWTAPEGYSFDEASGAFFMPLFSGPRTDPVLGPVYVRFDVGGLTNGASESIYAMTVFEISESFTDEQIDAYITFTGNDAGSKVTSPGGWAMWYTPGSATGQSFDSTLVFIGKYAIELRITDGVDAQPILDSFIDLNFE